MSASKPLKDLREDYGFRDFDMSSLPPDPVEQLRRWLDAAMHTEGEIEPNAMTLATVDSEGQPRARIVLLKDILEGDLVFFTNYQSSKGQELAHNNRCSVVFWWRLLHRQVRVQGEVIKADGEYSTRYFHSRPLGSQLGAIVSPQSQVIPNREVLDQAIAAIENELKPGQLPERPDHWGGYRIRPHYFEFWQGHTNRLHDRFQYRLEDHGWVIERLAP